MNEIDEIAKVIAAETFNIIKSLPKEGSDPTIPIVSRSLKFYLEKVILHVLLRKYGKNVTDEEAYQITHANFLELKNELQDNIAQAFDDAFIQFVGKKMDYYCIINPFPNPVNKEII